MKSFRTKDARGVYCLFYTGHDQSEVFVDGCKRKFTLVYYELARRAFPFDRNMQDPSFDEAVKVIDLTRRVMKIMGICPEKEFINELLFTVICIYLTVHCSLSVIEIAMNITDITYVVAILMEYMFIFLALIKIVVCKINRESLGRFIEDMRGDFSTEKYKTNEEKMAFLKYNKFSQKFIKTILISGFAASSSYFLMSLVANVEMAIANSSYGYKLPYKVWLNDPTNAVAYGCLVCYQCFIVPCLVFGYVGTDCLFICLVLHISGCFSALSCTIKEIMSDPRDRKLHLKNFVIKHVRLIRLSECLEDDFNLIILLQLIGSTSQFCLVGYDALVSSESGEAGLLFTFVLIVACVLSFLLIYCYIAECLIKESSFLGDCFYQCEWYNISRAELKYMHICMLRSTKQIKLTSGKFCTISLNTFSDVLKTSMAYFSVLRSFA